MCGICGHKPCEFDNPNDLMTAEDISNILWDIITKLPEPAQVVIEEIIGRLEDNIAIFNND